MKNKQIKKTADDDFLGNLNKLYTTEKCNATLFLHRGFAHSSTSRLLPLLKNCCVQDSETRKDISVIKSE